jgi:hypothetical protein
MRVFICYRREEATDAAGRLYDRLCTRFGRRSVFIDVDRMKPGEDVITKIHRSVRSCDVVLALMGPRWLRLTTPEGRRKLDDPDDFVRFELATALRSPRAKVIPVLINHARMPNERDLPHDLGDLPLRHAVPLRGGADWERDFSALEGAIRATVPPPDLRTLAWAFAGMILALTFALAAYDGVLEVLHKPATGDPRLTVVRFSLAWGALWSIVGLGIGALPDAASGDLRRALGKGATVAGAGALAGMAGGAIRGTLKLAELELISHVAAFMILGAIFGATRPVGGPRATAAAAGILGGLIAGLLVSRLLGRGGTPDLLGPFLAVLVIVVIVCIGSAAALLGPRAHGRARVALPRGA